MGNVIMVSSGKGGTGKSTFSVFCAEALAQLGSTALVVELDSGLRSVDVISGVYGNAVYDLEDVLTGRCEPEKAVIQSPRNENLFVMCAPYNSDVVQVDKFVDLCFALSQKYDYMIVDTAAGLSDEFYAAASVAMRAMVIATPDPVSVRDARIVADRLRDLSVQDVRLVINRLSPSHIKNKIIPDLDFCIDHVGAQLIGVIPDSPVIAVAPTCGAGLPDKSIEKKIFQNIAKRIGGNDVPLAIY